MKNKLSLLVIFSTFIFISAKSSEDCKGTFHPFFYQNECVYICPEGFFAEDNSNECVQVYQGKELIYKKDEGISGGKLAAIFVAVFVLIVIMIIGVFCCFKKLKEKEVEEGIKNWKNPAANNNKNIEINIQIQNNDAPKQGGK